MSRNPQRESSRCVTLEQMRVVLDFSPIPTAILQFDEVAYINPAGVALLGAEEAEQVFQSSILSDRSILKWLDPQEREDIRRKRIIEWMDRGERIKIARKKWVRGDGKWVQRDGGALLVEVRAWTIPLYGGHGTEITFTDVSEREQDEQTALDADGPLQLAIEAAEIGIWDYDPTSGKLRWSSRCKEMFGLQCDADVDYAAFLKLLHPEDCERTDNAVKESLNPNGTGKFGCDYRVLCPNGEVHWIAATGRAFFANTNGHRKATRVLGTVLDITGLRRTDASLRQTEKLAATGRLAASLAHEINNPLEAITNLLYLLHSSPLQAEQCRYVEQAEQELARVTDIVKQTLRFYQDPGTPTQCNLSEIIDSVLTLFGRRIEASGIYVERRYCRAAALFGAREELRQVLVNLIHNAMDAMPRGGRLLIRTKQHTKWSTGRKGIQLTVADTGHGMGPATRERMFEPFFTTRTSIGTGLGLWLSAGIVQKHAGTIRVKSCQHPYRSGTVFSIFLPLDRRQ
jgi:nitrogen-specific signal transduction histidine kinase